MGAGLSGGSAQRVAHAKWIWTLSTGSAPESVSRSAFVPSSFHERSLLSGPTYAEPRGEAENGAGGTEISNA